MKIRKPYRLLIQNDTDCQWLEPIIKSLIIVMTLFFGPPGNAAVSAAFCGRDARAPGSK